MTNKIYTFQLNLDFGIFNKLSEIDRFSGEWSGIARREGQQSLKQLKSIATVHSVGASTRIEGAKMTNDEVKEFIFDHLKIEKLVERDKQEVLGYFNTLDVISESYHDIDISESSLMNLHNILMKYSEKDQWHKGKYKQHPNSVEAINPDGTKTIIFNTTPPGIETENAIRELCEWYNADRTTHAIIKTAIFVYDFLSIHPFQDGNGRLSRLLGTLLLLKQDYPWIQYISFEHEIENRKAEYYKVLMDCQQNRPGENITSWILFFFDCMNNLQYKLKNKLTPRSSENQMSIRQKMIYSYVENHPGSKSSGIAEALNIPLPTVKKILAEMVAAKFVGKYGTSTGTNYVTEKITMTKTDVAHTFNDTERKKIFTLKDRYAFVSIKKFILRPKFHWQNPDDWGTVLLHQGLQLKITCYTVKGGMRSQPYLIGAFNTPYHYQPVFTLNTPIHIPLSLWEKEPFENEFPIKVEIELYCSEDALKFDVMIVYDASLE